ncbi:MAG: hypothetical protein HY595_01340 [Candidatus Omnitrophica bacterium]|nr:hypothetical protein [Candidatus Omnitrophota bacterium]
MRRAFIGLGVLGVWVSVATVLAGFVQPWASIDVKYRDVARDVTGAVDAVAQEAGLGDVLASLSKRVGRIAVSVKQGTETIAGELPDLSTIPTEISGADIPRLANRKDAHVVLALAEMWTGHRELGTKSYVVYLIPGLVLLAGVLVTVFRGARWLCVLVGLTVLAIAGFAGWKISTTHTDTLLVAITIEPGLWRVCWGYAGFGLSALLLALTASTRL